MKKRYECPGCDVVMAMPEPGWWHARCWEAYKRGQKAGDRTGPDLLRETEEPPPMPTQPLEPQRIDKGGK